MGRKARIEYYGATYHIVHRGNKQRDIFEDFLDKMKFLEILGEVKEIFDFYLISYCILENEYHLIIKVHNIPLSKIMHRVNTNYARYYNREYKSKGSLFKGRYKSNIIKGDNELLDMVKYLHRKPIEEGLSDSIEDYKWSSDVFYRINLQSIVNIDYLLDIMYLDRDIAITNYIEYMDKTQEG